MATKVKEAAGAVERLLLPRLNSIDGELKSINTTINSSKNELHAEIRAVDTKVTEMDKRNSIEFQAIRNEMRGLSEKVDLVKDMEKLKLEVAELKRRR
jgi:hypothetical protein